MRKASVTLKEDKPKKSVKEFTQSQRTLEVKKARTMSSEAEDRDKILAERYSTMSNARLEGETFEEYKRA